jgi:hypothetical protein
MTQQKHNLEINSRDTLSSGRELISDRMPEIRQAMLVQHNPLGSLSRSPFAQMAQKADRVTINSNHTKSINRQKSQAVQIPTNDEDSSGESEEANTTLLNASKKTQCGPRSSICRRCPELIIPRIHVAKYEDHDAARLLF